MLKIETKIFTHNLRLTQEYCSLQLDKYHSDNSQVFRSYNPILNGKALFDFKINYLDYDIKPTSRSYTSIRWTLDPIDNEDLVDKLFDGQINFKEKQVSIDVGRTYQGDILISQIDCTVVDGASEVQSLGLVDVYDMPPIDTWFYLTRSKESRLLFAWIPNELRHYANEAILVNCVDCINWFSAWYPQDFEQFMANAQHGVAKSGA